MAGRTPFPRPTSGRVQATSPAPRSALVSAFPSLAPHNLLISVAVLAFLTAVNMRGIAASAKVFLLPTAVFVFGIYTVIVSGTVRAHAAANASFHPAIIPKAAATVGVLMLLKAFAAGCSALTGVEAIANDVPVFREPRAQRAMRTEVMLGGLLGTMLLGLAYLTVRFHIAPSSHQTVLSQITAASVGRGPVYYVIDLATTVILALAANTSFGGFPVLVSLLARDNLVPHVFGLRGDRPVFRYGVAILAVFAGVLLVAVGANTNALIPLYAIGVFTGFTLSQGGLVKHWWRERPAGWWTRAGLNGTGAVMTGVATVIFLVTKFTSGAWVVVIAIPALILLFSRIERYYNRVATALGFGKVPRRPQGGKGIVIVPVAHLSRMTEFALEAALALSDEVVAVSIQFDKDRAAELKAEWERWDPGVELDIVHSPNRSIATPILEYLERPKIRQCHQVLVLIPEVEPSKWRHRLLQNQRDVILANVLRRETDVIVARLPFRLSGD